LTPFIPPLVPQKRWNTNPSIFIEEYREDEMLNDKSCSSSASKISNDKTSVRNEPALSATDIKSFGDLSQIPFIDDDINNDNSFMMRDRVESLDEKLFDATCEQKENSENFTSLCRKTVSFDMLSNCSNQQQCTLRPCSKNGKNFPQKTPSKLYTTDKNPLFHTLKRYRQRDQRSQKSSSNDGIDTYDIESTNNLFKIIIEDQKLQSNTEKTKITTTNDNNDKKISGNLDMWEQNEHNVNKTSRNASSSISSSSSNSNGSNNSKNASVSVGKVKALTSFYNSLPFIRNECNCIRMKSQSTPNLTVVKSKNGKMSAIEVNEINRQLNELSTFGVCESSDEKLVCGFMQNELPKITHHPRHSHFHKHYLLNNFNCHRFPCKNACAVVGDDSDNSLPPHRIVAISEKHKCRSPCYNIKRVEKSKKIQKHKKFKRLDDEENDDNCGDDKSFII
jgi:hypothetical protein